MGALAEYVTENKYEMLSKFETVKEFNNHYEQAMLLHKDKFTKSEYMALNKLRKYAFSETSLNTVGVAWSKIQNVVAATHKDAIFGISRATFDRMMRKAKRLNLITVINQFKKNKYQKHSVYVFNRLDELTPEKFETVRIVSEKATIDVPKSVKIDAPITILLELTFLKDLKTYQQAENVVDKESNVIDFKETKTDYQKMCDVIDGLFSDHKTKYRMYGVWLAQTKGLINKPPFELALRAIRLMILETKRRNANNMKPLNNPTGYFNGILKNMLARQAENDIVEDTEKVEHPRKGVVREILPHWFKKENEHVQQPVQKIDYEIERIRILKSLGYSEDEISEKAL